MTEEEATFGQGQQGTLLALGLAAFVALVAGMVVAFIRKPS
jgi:hypothetical protein